MHIDMQKQVSSQSMIYVHDLVSCLWILFSRVRPVSRAFIHIYIWWWIWLMLLLFLTHFQVVLHVENSVEISLMDSSVDFWSFGILSLWANVKSSLWAVLIFISNILLKTSQNYFSVRSELFFFFSNNYLIMIIIIIIIEQGSISSHIWDYYKWIWLIYFLFCSPLPFPYESWIFSSINQGDVILSINEENEINDCLKEYSKGVRNVKVVPCSPLRNPLINYVTPPDYRPIP